MNRIEQIQLYINAIFSRMPDAVDSATDCGHTYGVAQCCALLAAKRGLDGELAYIAGLGHDIYGSKTGTRRLHAQNGSEMLRVAFKNELAGLFSNEEQTVIKSAVFHHSDKWHVHDAYDELKNGWCAAFVCHCCLEAGFLLPIRTYQTADRVSDYRLAAPIAWYEWGAPLGFCHTEKDGFVPERGDIVIYNNLIPAVNKTAGGVWADHAGIVLAADGGRLTVAEGNVGNQNVSGIMSRRRDDTIGCYIRIPDDYEYDGWKTDYKTGKIRVVDLREEYGAC